MQIIDDFLPTNVFLVFKQRLMGKDMTWKQGKVLHPDDPNVDEKCDELDNFQFEHVFYNVSPSFPEYNLRFNQFSDESFNYGLMSPLLHKLTIRSLVKIKANLNPRTSEIIEHGYHMDYPYENCKTSIFYVNTNNGYTKFEDGTVVESVENRLVTFDTMTKHTGSTCTDQKCRMVINLNYF